MDKRALFVVLVASLVPSNAQSATDGFDLARAITREAERFAESQSLRWAGILQPASSIQPDWSRVRLLPTLTRVTVVVRGVKSSRYFVTADEEEMTVLNFVDPLLPPDARRILLDLVRRQPGYFATRQPPEVFEEGNVRVDSSGVFVGGQMVTTLERLVERFTSHEITEIRTSRGQGTFMGKFGGFFVIAAVITGAVGGGMLGHRWFARYGGAFGEDVIYRAP